LAKKEWELNKENIDPHVDNTMLAETIWINQWVAGYTSYEFVTSTVPIKHKIIV